MRSLLQQFSRPFQQFAIAMASFASRRRLHLLPPTIAFLLLVLPGMPRASRAEAGEQPRDNRRLGTIFNNDANNILYAMDPGKTNAQVVADYRRCVDEIVASLPGILAQNVGNPDPVIYRSREATSWSKYVGDHQSVAMNKMLAAGTDPLQVTIDACRARGVPIVASYRMNAEDFYARTLEIQDFGREHRDLVIPGAYCLDPKHPVVYQHRLAIFREVAENYDIDGLEFDFRRWCHMISDPLENHVILTRMVRETRQMLDEVARRKGRPRLLLGVRVGPSLDTPESVARYAGGDGGRRNIEQSCKELGLDVRTWVDESLVDYVSPSLFWPDWPGLPRIREFVDLAKDRNVGVYPTLFPRPTWLNDSGEVQNRGPVDLSKTGLIREYKDGFCQIGLQAYAEGADGLSTYNWYFHLHLANAPLQWHAYYGYDMGGSLVQREVLSRLHRPAALREYLAAEQAWPESENERLARAYPAASLLQVLNPSKLPASLPVNRATAGVAGDEHPTLAATRDGELLLVFEHTYDNEPTNPSMPSGGPAGSRTDLWLCRSRDEGRRWSLREPLPFPGRRPHLHLEDDGAITLTVEPSAGASGQAMAAAVSAAPPANTAADTTTSFTVYRSNDGGKTWGLREGELDAASGAARTAGWLDGPYEMVTGNDRSLSAVRLAAGGLLVTVLRPAASGAAGSQLEAIWLAGGPREVRGTNVVRLAEAPDRIALHQPEVPGVAPALQAASTVQLAGGPLVTAYAYEDAFGQSRMATARWELPAATEPSSKSIQPAAPPASCRNSLGMSLVYCAPGEFLMGSPDNDATARPDEKPQVRVRLTPGFYLGRHEVTQAEWQAVMETTPWKNQEREHEGARHAATFVSWDDAREFCRRLSEREGLRYRLPTEAEWEYACRAGTTTRFSFGDAAERLGEFGWWGRDVREGNAHEEPWTHEVGLKRANPWGFYDMHGNCWEWCDTPAGLPLAAANSVPAQVAADARRSIRGGGWCHLPNECRSAYRPGDTADSRHVDLGFRVLLELPR